MIPSILYQIVEGFINYCLLKFGVDWPDEYRVMVKSRWVIPWRKAPWFGGGVVCCVLPKSVDVEVPKRAISQVHEKIFSATYIQAMPRAVLREDGE